MAEKSPQDEKASEEISKKINQGETVLGEHNAGRRDSLRSHTSTSSSLIMNSFKSAASSFIEDWKTATSSLSEGWRTAPSDLTSGEEWKSGDEYFSAEETLSDNGKKPQEIEQLEEKSLPSLYQPVFSKQMQVHQTEFVKESQTVTDSSSKIIKKSQQFGVMSVIKETSVSSTSFLEHSVNNIVSPLMTSTPLPAIEQPLTPSLSTNESSDVDPLIKHTKESAQWIKVKILEMQPELAKLGSDLTEALELQRQHEDILIKLQGKQSPVEELLNQADQLISTQKARPEVYAAMADSLSQAWRDLNAQLELRKQLLDQNVIFLTRAQEFTDRMNAAEKTFTDPSVPEDAESVKTKLQYFHDIKKGFLEASMHSLNEGQILLDRLKQQLNRGTDEARADAIVQSINSAIFQVEHHLETLHDRRKKLEDLWSKCKHHLEECLQFYLLNQDLNQIQHWLNTRGSEIIRCTSLGDSSASAEILQHEHNKLQNEVKDIQNRAIRLLRTAEQLCAKNHHRGLETRDHAYKILEQFSEITLHIDNRSSLLSLAVNFFRSAVSAFNKLDQIEIQLATSVDLPSSSAQLVQLHAQLAAAIKDAVTPAINEGHQLLERAGRNDPGTFGVKYTVEELEKRQIKLNSLCTAHKPENVERAAAINVFRQSFSMLYTWIINIGEAFLQGHQDMGSVLAMAKDFLNVHEQLQNEVENKGAEIDALFKSVPHLVCTDDTEAYEVQEKSETLRNHWLNLKSMLDHRIRIAAVYVKFHKLAVQLANEMDDLEKIFHSDASQISESELRNIDERWLAIQQLRLQLMNTGKNFIQDIGKINDNYLDIKRAVLCVETLLEHFQQRHEQLSALRESWQKRLSSIKDYHSQCIIFDQESRKIIHIALEIEIGLYPILTGNMQSSQAVIWDLESLHNTNIPKLKQIQMDLELALKTGETLSISKEFHSQRDGTVRDLMKTHQKVQVLITEYQILLSMLQTYFKNILELEKMIEKYVHQFGEVIMPHDVPQAEALLRDQEASYSTVMELIKFTLHESNQIILRIRQQEPEKVAHIDEEKITFIIQLKQNQWEKAWRDHKRRLEQNLQLCQFNHDLQQINTHLDELMTQLSRMRGNYGESLSAARATSEAFIQFEKTIQLLEQRIQIFVSTAEKMLSEQHYESRHILYEIEKVQSKWSAFYRQVGENRMLINLSIEYFKLIEEAEEWFKEGSTLLVTIARKTTNCRTPQDATNLLSELEMFLKPGEFKQEERLRKISSMALQLYGNTTPVKMELVESKNREMLESFTVINEELSTLAVNLKTAEQHKAQQKKEKEVIDSQLAAAAEETRKAAELSVKKIIGVNIHQIEVVKQEAVPIKKTPTPPKEVKLIPPAFTVPLQDAEIPEGTKFKFECRVIGFPSPDIHWYKDGIPITNNPDYHTQFHDGICSLTIEETFSEDSARFLCRATNSAGIAETHGKLTVKELHPSPELQPPEFTRQLEPGFAKEGDTFRFECEVKGNPLPLVSWYKDEVCIDNVPEYEITYNNGICVLNFPEIFIEDNARYTCKASNQVGQATSTSRLTVEPAVPSEPPKFIEPLSNVMARAGQKLRLECHVKGQPHPQVTWLHNYKTVKDTHDCKVGTSSNVSDFHKTETNVHYNFVTVYAFLFVFLIAFLISRWNNYCTA